MRPALQFRHVFRSYGGRAVVNDASFALHAGQISCLLGPSGCGKSTILRLIAGLETVDCGEILLDEVPISGPAVHMSPERRGVGLVFQDNALFPHLDVRNNVGFGLRSRPSSDRAQRVDALLQRFHIAHLAADWPHTLSGGEQQRVAIARALAREPRLLLLDEPFSGLDGHLRGQIRRSLLADLGEVGAAVLVVTHDPEEAMMIADQLILMNDGRILQGGEPADCYANPVSAAAARLLGEIVLLPAFVRTGLADTPMGTVAAPGMLDGPAQLLVRPENLLIGAEGTGATVVDVRNIGPAMVADVRLGDDPLSLRLKDSNVRAGQTIRLSADAGKLRIVPLANDAVVR